MYPFRHGFQHGDARDVGDEPPLLVSSFEEVGIPLSVTLFKEGGLVAYNKVVSSLWTILRTIN